MKNLCIIPARGGSKRIPRKNIRSFLGKPIIAYPIEIALQSGLFDEVMVSTDDDEIAEVAQKYGAVVPFRRSTLNANDFATTAEVLTEVLTTYKKNGIAWEYACCIYPTAVLIKEARLKEALNLLQKKKYDSVFPVVEFSYPIWRSLTMNEQGLIRMRWPEYLTARSQDLPKAYHDAGQFYWFGADTFGKTKTLVGDNTGSIVLSEMEVQDIDNASDWLLAELKATINMK